jgi:hypothetical protein
VIAADLDRLEQSREVHGGPCSWFFELRRRIASARDAAV